MAKFFDIDLLKKHPRYTLVGYKSKARTKPWIITDNQRSGEFIITDDQAKTLFGKKDVDEFIERQREHNLMLKLTLKDLWDLREWVDQMYWDYDRLSRSGQDTLKKISNKLGMDTSDYLSEKM